MANYKLKINMLRLQGAFVSNIKGKSATKRCICIPIDDAHLFLGEKGCYLDLNAWEMRGQSPYGSTHYLKQQLGKDTYSALTEDQRRSMPILGDMSPHSEYSNGAPVATAQTPPETQTEDQLPF